MNLKQVGQFIKSLLTSDFIEEQMLRILTLQTIKEKKQVTTYNPDKRSMNPFYVGPASIFVLGKESPKKDSYFLKTRRAIQYQSKGTIVEKEIISDFYKFAQKWKRVIDYAPSPIKAQKRKFMNDPNMTIQCYKKAKWEHKTLYSKNSWVHSLTTPMNYLSSNKEKTELLAFEEEIV